MYKTEDLLITEDMIFEIHQQFSKNPQKNYRQTSLSSGADPEDIPRLMQHFIEQIHSSKHSLKPEELAFMAWKRLMDIQPFETGNQETADALKQYILEACGCDKAADMSELFSDMILIK